MTYVFVQHLDPRHGSHLAKILSKRAALPVEEAREGVEISPDHLYVIECIIIRLGLFVSGFLIYLPRSGAIFFVVARSLVHDGRLLLTPDYIFMV